MFGNVGRIEKHVLMLEKHVNMQIQYVNWGANEELSFIADLKSSKVLLQLYRLFMSDLDDTVQLFLIV